jgi:hypothetical protein
MTLIFGKSSPLIISGLSRLLVSFTILIIAAAGPARAADGTVQVWQGQYKSKKLGEMVHVQLTLNATPPELRFMPPIDCLVGLAPSSKGSTNVYGVVPYKKGESSGQYCGFWVGKTLTVQKSNDGRQLTIILGDTVSVTLTPAS